MRKKPSLSRRNWERLLVNGALILICIFAMLPIATTLLISFKSQQDITRKPPVIFPCDSTRVLTCQRSDFSRSRRKLFLLNFSLLNSFIDCIRDPFKLVVQVRKK